MGCNEHMKQRIIHINVGHRRHQNKWAVSFCGYWIIYEDYKMQNIFRCLAGSVRRVYNSLPWDCEAQAPCWT